MLFLNDIYKQEYKNNKALLLKGNEVISFKELIKKIEEFSKNIKKRSLIFLVCKNNPESIVGYLGSIKSNCVISLIDENISDNSFNKLIKNYHPDFIFFEKKRIKNLDNFSVAYSFKTYELLEAKKKTEKKFNDELALLISTSGSTGTSKLVRQSASNLINNISSIVEYLNISEKDVTITTLPMSYVYGLSIINTHLSQGASVVLNNYSIIQKEFWNKVQKNKVTNFGGVPYTYSILEKINLKNFNLTSLKYTTQAGGKINKQTAENILKIYNLLDVKLYIMYGAAEATARMSYLPWENIDKIESIGKAIPGGNFFLEDSNSKIITKTKTPGELIYKGKNVCLGYAEKFEDLTKNDENNGTLKTGDIAYKDKDNFYYLVGRKDRYIKIHGMRINLQELESIISDFGFKNICIQEKENKINVLIKGDFQLEKLKEYLVSITKIHPSVFIFKTVKDFPLNKNFKTSYNIEMLK
jgi:long-chain acyl-CoA synthetase|tara:strand:+ start:2085 stop:3497 length:1413 start_codon:yes stop_codon:yes gene_type:complete